jgi:hypothetical protein
MIGLGTPLFDLDGHMVLMELPNTDLGEARRRVNRQKTLDGGVVVNDSGYATGDRTINIRWRIRSLEQYRAVERLVKLYPRLTAATSEGCFTVAPDRLKRTRTDGDLTLLVVS